MALGKAGLTPGDIRMTFAGDLLAQTTASSFGIAGMGIPFYGLFGACSTIGESLSLGAMSAAAGYGEHILCATSSHFASAEKEFRFPLAYGNQRPLSATWTVTGSGACVLSGTLPVPEIPEKTDPLISAEGCVQITGLTTGKLIDFGLKDSLNMVDAWHLPPAIPFTGIFVTLTEHLMIMMQSSPETWELLENGSCWIC